MSAFLPPPGYPRIKVVGGFAELLATPWADGINALCWPRALPEGFGEIVDRLESSDDLTDLDEARLHALPLGAAGRAARDFMLADLQRLRAEGLAPVLNRIRRYPRDDATAVVPTDVYSFHADSAPVAADTWLCTYHGAPSEGLRNDEARRRSDDPAVRAALLREYGGADDADFKAWLRENSFDLHYAPLPGAQPFSFGLGHLWRIALAHPGSPVPPCLHRAPADDPDRPRLLLIS
ncbi:MAG: hypothetical protein KIT44_06795 [Opitutaceae bacterium]|nr:hypothetical protein [Opitutaceae bacterium]